MLTRLRLVPSAEFFLEGLLSTVKGNLISYQTWYKKVETSRKAQLIKNLNELKVNYDQNYNEIFNLENILNELVQRNLQAKIKTMKIFASLNAEKPTPMFLNLAKKTTKAKITNWKLLKNPTVLPLLVNTNGTDISSITVKAGNVVTFLAQNNFFLRILFR